MGLAMTSDTAAKPLFYEPGASWYWLLGGPLAAASVIYIQKSSGAPISLLVPTVFLVLVSAFGWTWLGYVVSLFRAGLGLRSACAAALSSLLWLAILWAIGS